MNDRLHAVKFDAGVLQLAERVVLASANPTAYKSDLGEWNTVERISRALLQAKNDSELLLAKRNRLAEELERMR